MFFFEALFVLDISFKNKLTPQKGRVLLADPFLADEYFQLSVVYLCEHSKAGSFGFVLNNYVDISINELNPNFPALKVKLSLGGPVETESLYFLHTLGHDLNESIELKNGIYIGGDFEQLTTVLTKEHFLDNKIRFFLGYAGWEARQLSEELKLHNWIVANVDNLDEIMSTRIEDPWTYFMNKLDPKFQVISKFPINPNDN